MSDLTSPEGGITGRQEKASLKDTSQITIDSARNVMRGVEAVDPSTIQNYADYEGAFGALPDALDLIARRTIVDAASSGEPRQQVSVGLREFSVTRDLPNGGYDTVAVSYSDSESLSALTSQKARLQYLADNPSDGVHVTHNEHPHGPFFDYGFAHPVDDPTSTRTFIVDRASPHSPALAPLKGVRLFPGTAQTASAEDLQRVAKVASSTARLMNNWQQGQPLPNASQK